MAKRRKKRTLYRDSINGQFITEKEAECRPATTVKETVYVKTSTRDC